MACRVLIGAQWGDEGKGKIIDFLTQDAQWVVRYQGGNNAGHTVEVGDTRYVLHLIPSGILHEGKRAVIGHGVVVDPLALLEEIDMLAGHGISIEGRLLVSDRAHVVFPYHPQVDACREGKPTGDKIGTTRRGIGPAYADKVARTGLRFADLLDTPAFPELLRPRLAEKNLILEAHGMAPIEEGPLLATYQEAAERLRPYVADTVVLLNEARRRGEGIFFEGAQGTMLDIDFGTYPFVTSSSASAGGACTGSGIAPHHMDEVVGVIKAYTTRVGEGPFPTELDNAEGEALRTAGREFGATTGRPRRCGWFDGVVARYSAMVNGIDAWALTKLDVLDEVATIRICTGYELRGRTIRHIPASVRDLTACRPVYEDVEGWRAPTKGATCLADLPPGARAYIRRLEEVSGVPVGYLSVGPRRDETFRVPRAD